MTRAAAVRAALIGLAAAAAACDPGVVSVEIIDYDPDRDLYDFAVVDIETLRDVDRLEGRATRLVGDAVVELSYQTNRIRWLEPGYRVAFGAVRAGDALVPEDFDSLAMVSIYYQIERSLLFFEERGFDSGRLVPMQTYYWPEFTIVEADGAEQIMEDNAFYLYATAEQRDFYVFPHRQFQWLPLSMNGGVMTHEFAHAVFDALVTEPNRAWIDAGGLGAAATNFTSGLNEGFADLAAVARLGDADFMRFSIAEGVFTSSCNGSVRDIVRDAARPMRYTDGMDWAARHRPPADFCPYDIGAFVSAAIFEAQRRADGLPADTGEGIPAEEVRDAAAEAAVLAADRLGGELTEEFAVWQFFDLLLEELPDEALRGALCEVLSERYTIYYSQLAGC